MGTQCIVIDPLNSGMTKGRIFASQRDVARALPKGVGMQVALQAGLKTFKFRRTEKMIFIEPFSTGEAATAPIRKPTFARATKPGHTSYRVVNIESSGLAANSVHGGMRPLVRKMPANTSCTVRDLNTNIEYAVRRAGSTYRVEAIK